MCRNEEERCTAMLVAGHNMLQWPPSSMSGVTEKLVNGVQLARGQALSLNRLLLTIGPVHISASQLLTTIADSCDVVKQPLKKVCFSRAFC